MKLLWKALLWAGGILALLIASFFVYGMYLTKELPWQEPVFDSEVPPNPGSLGNRSVLLFYKTNGFEHESIGTGLLEITTQGEGRGWNVISSDNGAFFNDDYLSKFKVVVFLSTTGDVLTKEQEAAFERFITNGGGYVGIHSATDTEYEWGWYNDFVGTHFRDHSLFPHTPKGTILTEQSNHYTTSHLPERWDKVEEWYNFKNSIRNEKGFRVLLSVDESTYDVGESDGMNGDHPISWISENLNGRMFYTALGHEPETFTEGNSMKHILRGIEWAGKFNEAEESNAEIID
jgi:type 1 glutamine amidotransferase